MLKSQRAFMGFILYSCALGTYNNTYNTQKHNKTSKPYKDISSTGNGGVFYDK